jgi:hypothetical protein
MTLNVITLSLYCISVITLNQACQTGGPIACPIRPVAILLDLKIMLINLSLDRLSYKRASEQ